VKSVKLAEHLPKTGTVAVSGGRLEREILSAIAYANEMGANLRLIPLSPSQLQDAFHMGIPLARGYPTLFLLQAEYRGPDYFLQSRTFSVFADRIMAKAAEQVWALVTDRRKEVLVEAVPYFIEYTLDGLSLYGEVEKRVKNHFGHVLITLKPREHDYFSLAHLVRDVPGVIDVGIYLEPPDKVIDLR